jgi:conjugal transfer ATP-binding protein TraC
VSVAAKRFSIAAQVPTAEVSGSVVLNVDGSLAFGLSLAPVDFTSTSSSALSATCQQLSEFFRRLPENVVIQLVAELTEKPSVGIEKKDNESDDPGDRLASDIADHARRIRFRQVRFFVFVCLPYSFQNALLVRSGGIPSRFPRWKSDAYDKVRKELERVATSVAGHLGAIGLRTAPMKESELLAFISSQLNPGRHIPVPQSGRGHDAKAGPLDLRQLDPRRTLREQLCSSDFEQHAQFVSVNGVGFRTLCVKELPDEPELGLLAELFFGVDEPCRICITVEKLPVGLTRFALRRRKNMVEGEAQMSGGENFDANAQHEDIRDALIALSRQQESMVSLQITCTSFGQSWDELCARTNQLEEVFTRAGVSTWRNDYSHLDVYMSQLPGAAHFFRLSKSVSDKVAANFFVPFGSWRGHKTSRLLLRSRAGDPLPFDPFSDECINYNGLVFGNSGSGKSFFVNYLLVNHLAAGGGAVVVDIGGSYRRLVNLFGGSYIDVGDSSTGGLCPLILPPLLNAKPPAERKTYLHFFSTFIEQLVDDKIDLPKEQRAIFGGSMLAFYDPKATHLPERKTPTVSDFQAFLRNFGGNDFERTTAQMIARKLDYWTQGIHADIFERPVGIELSTSITAIDLKSLVDDELIAIGLNVIGQSIWRILESSQNTRKFIVPFDEVWKVLKTDAGSKYIEEFGRTLRKLNAGLWLISQAYRDFCDSPIAATVVEQSFHKILLRHGEGHDELGRVLELKDHATEQFRKLGGIKGQYSEVLVKSGEHVEVAQVIPSPLGYWMATTNPNDKQLERRVQAKNPDASMLRILESLAAKHPHGV